MAWVIYDGNDMASPSTLLCAAGEHQVMTELLRRGYIAALALRTVKGGQRREKKGTRPKMALCVDYYQTTLALLARLIIPIRRAGLIRTGMLGAFPLSSTPLQQRGNSHLDEHFLAGRPTLGRGFVAEFP
jgi:hypothetical protein